MEKLATLKFQGDFEHGFQVTLEIGADGQRPFADIQGRLPPNSDIPIFYECWRSSYRHLFSSRIQVKFDKVYTFTELRENCWRAAAELKQGLATWLQASSFQPMREKCFEHLTTSDEIRMIVRSDCPVFLKLPWHQWEVVERYDTIEVAVSSLAAEYPQTARPPISKNRVRILAILGNSLGIDVQQDQRALAKLSGAETLLLNQPRRKQINDQLWAQPWDMLFFAGHSETQAATGRFYINRHDYLTIADLQYGLKCAIANGLQLAIFNSCDGLDLAWQLAELRLPQIIVMREPVPDRVAQAFLQSFLKEFARGSAFYQAVGTARKQLQGLEHQYPCASWLPTIVQNAAAIPPTWKELRYGNIKDGNMPFDSIVPYPARSQTEQLLLAAVKREVNARLKQSLHNAVLINLGKEAQPRQVKRPWDTTIKIGEKPSEPIPETTTILDIFDQEEIGGRLLILGVPGSGKTTTQLELAQDLIERAEVQTNFPIPVLFNLSSWKDDTQSIAVWLVAELKSKYGVRVDIGQQWLENKQLLPLLDSLDELESARQPQCLRAIDQWLAGESRPQYLVVCSRSEEYEILVETAETKLQLNGAICLQTLTNPQIQDYLETIERAELWQAMERDTALLDLVRTPLLLSVTILAYGELSLTQWQQLTSTEERLQVLLDAYVQRMLIRPVDSRQYRGKWVPSARQTRRQLIWLAQQLQRQSQTEFLIEKLQPTWLLTKSQQTIYHLAVYLAMGLIGGLATALHYSTRTTDNWLVAFSLLWPSAMFGVVAGLVAGLISRVTFRWMAGIIAGVLFALAVMITITKTVLVGVPEPDRHGFLSTFFVIDGLSAVVVDGSVLAFFFSLIPPHIKIVDTMKWSWLKFKTYSILSLIGGAIYVLFRLVLTDRYVSENGLTVGIILYELLIFALIAGLVGGLSKGPEIEKIAIPNQGIWRSATNARFLFCAVGTVGTGLAWPYAYNLYELVSVGVAIGVLAGLGGGWFSGLVLIQHLILRVMIWWQGHIPWNYARFLNYATERTFLQKVGGGYRFIHRLLMDHLARMDLPQGRHRSL